MTEALIRLEVYHTSKPRRRVLVSVGATVTQEALHDAIATRLGLRPERCCLGETEAAVLTASDLRDGDVVRVVSPALPESDAAAAEGSAATERIEPDAWRTTLRLVLTLVIFIALQVGFQRFVFTPWYRPDMLPLRGERVSEDEY